MPGTTNLGIPTPLDSDAPEARTIREGFAATDGLIAQVRGQVDAAGPSVAANALVRRDAAGSFTVPTPTDGGNPTPKAYVDERVRAGIVVLPSQSIPPAPGNGSVVTHVLSFGPGWFAATPSVQVTLGSAPGGSWMLATAHTGATQSNVTLILKNTSDTVASSTNEWRLHWTATPVNA